jgi:hypothetical protein
MKKTLLTVASVLSFLVAPAPAFALFNVNQGGTGQSTFTSGALLYGNGTSPIATTGAGTLGYVLQFNGTFPTWVSTSSLGIVPGGSVGHVQFNDGGVFGGDSGFTFDKVSGVLRLPSDINMNSATAVVFGGGTGPTIGGDEGGPMQIGGDSDTAALLIYGTDGGEAILNTNKISGFSPQRYFSFPDADGTFGLLEVGQTWTGANTFDQGPVGTTTVNFGHMGSSTSHVCFNTKNTDGQDVSFFIVGTSIVVEANACQ